MKIKPTNFIELPFEQYERFKEISLAVQRYELDPDTAREQVIDLIGPYVDHLPDLHEFTEISLKKVEKSIPKPCA